jgi:hypothetical protein
MASTYSQITTQTLGSAASTITFSNIPQIYTNLILVIAGQASAQIDLNFRFNADTGSNYSRTYMGGASSSSFSGRDSSGTSVAVGSLNTNMSNCIVHFPQYSNTTTYKTVLERANQPQSAGPVNAIVGLWRSTSQITSMTLTTSTGTVSTNSIFTLYGIKGA